MLSFDATILTGLFGALCYIVAPRIMTSIEGDPLLIEDLEGRRAELQADLEKIRSSCDTETRTLIDRKIRKYFSSVSYLLIQYIRREELTAALAKTRLRFKAEILAPETKAGRDQILKAVEKSVLSHRTLAVLREQDIGILEWGTAKYLRLISELVEEAEEGDYLPANFLCRSRNERQLPGSPGRMNDTDWSVLV